MNLVNKIKNRFTNKNDSSHKDLEDDAEQKNQN